MTASEQPGAISVKYKIDTSDIGLVKTMTFEMRNFGDAPIKPFVTAYVGGTDNSAMKEFEYDQIPPGYKMVKTETVNMPVSGLHEPNAIKGVLKDVLQNKKILGEDSKTYTAKPSG